MLPRISRVQCNEAEYLLFSTSDYISNTLFRTGTWEEHLFIISKMFYSHIDSPLILDVGANLGAYSIPIARDIQNKNGRVIGFEPQRIIYYQLCANIFLNRLENYYAIHQALGDRNQIIEIPEMNYEINGNIGAFSLEKKYRELHGIEQSVKKDTSKVLMTKLDDLIVDRSPALIKIDVEGHELNVLKGGKNFLENHNFPPIMFEAWNLDWFKNEREELISFIENLGYSTTVINQSDYIAQHPKNPVLLNFISNENGGTNIVRVR